jgi:hypothetical protein
MEIDEGFGSISPSLEHLAYLEVVAGHSINETRNDHRPTEAHSTTGSTHSGRGR